MSNKQYKIEDAANSCSIDNLTMKMEKFISNILAVNALFMKFFRSAEDYIRF